MVAWFDFCEDVFYMVPPSSLLIGSIGRTLAGYQWNVITIYMVTHARSACFHDISYIDFISIFTYNEEYTHPQMG